MVLKDWCNDLYNMTILDELNAKFPRFMLAYPWVVAESFYDAAHFGKSLLKLERGNLLLTFERDRSALGVSVGDTRFPDKEWSINPFLTPSAIQDYKNGVLLFESVLDAIPAVLKLSTGDGRLVPRTLDLLDNRHSVDRPRLPDENETIRGIRNDPFNKSIEWYQDLFCKDLQLCMRCSQDWGYVNFEPARAAEIAQYYLDHPEYSRVGRRMLVESFMSAAQSQLRAGTLDKDTEGILPKAVQRAMNNPYDCEEISIYWNMREKSNLLHLWLQLQFSDWSPPSSVWEAYSHISSLQRRIMGLLVKHKRLTFAELINAAIATTGNESEIQAVAWADVELSGQHLIGISWAPINPPLRQPSHRAIFNFYKREHEFVEWSKSERRWIARPEAESNFILLTDKGMSIADQILAEDQWPRLKMSQYEMPPVFPI